MDSILEKTGQDASRFLDVGVNVGQTLLKWKSIYPEVNYVGFEPNKKCVVYVEELIAKNQFKMCKIHPFGISTSKADAQLYLLGRDPGDSSASTIENFRTDQNRTGISVELIPLKDLEKDPFDLIKIDVEGSELEVLKSIFETQQEAVIICEILPVYSTENTDRLARQKAIETLLLINDYVIYRILKAEKITIKKLDEFGIHGDMRLSDYIFIPKTKEATIIAKFN
jgi:FkbM family methyltransferase